MSVFHRVLSRLLRPIIVQAIRDHVEAEVQAGGSITSALMSPEFRRARDAECERVRASRPPVSNFLVPRGPQIPTPGDQQ